MKVEIHSRMSIKKLIEEGFPKNTAVISFYTPQKMRRAEDVRIDYSGVCNKVFYIAVPDIDLKCLSDYGYTYDTYIEDTVGLAEFIYDVHSCGMDIICQCDFGQSRSAACAAAILEHFESRGIDVFADYRYYPNQLVYHKVFDALEKHVYDKAVNYIKTVPDYISVDNLQRKIGIGFGMARKITDKLFSDGVIERSEDKNRESYKLSRGGDVK